MKLISETYKYRIQELAGLFLDKTFKDFFDEDALNKSKNDSEGILVLMNVNDFLSIANKGESKDKKEFVNNLFKTNKKFNEIPFILYTHNNNGVAKVIGHEGRHRAIVLKENGITVMPVLMKKFSGGEGSYLINQKNFLNKPEFFDEEFPKVLKGELENSHNCIPFPITIKGESLLK